MQVKTLEINCYKSIKRLKLDCAKMNIFIGPPNTGKSNILEALGLLSLFNNECKITDLARFQTLYNLFHDNDIARPIEIMTEKHRLKMAFKENFEVFIETKGKASSKSFDLSYDQNGKLLNTHPHYTSPVKYYKFKPANYFDSMHSDFLRPPFGENMMVMLLKNTNIRKQISQIYEAYGLKFVVNPNESSIDIQKEEDGVVISHAYTLVSATLQRIAFYLCAIGTNSDSIIVIEEPESSNSPYFTGMIGHEMAKDATNQMFISTYSHLLLKTILEAMPCEDIRIYYTTYAHYETCTTLIHPEDVLPLTDGASSMEDVFMRLNGKKKAATRSRTV